MRFNDLVMAILMLVFFLFVNNYVPLAGLVNLLFNCFMLVVVVIYMLQFMGIVTSILPTLKFFK